MVKNIIIISMSCAMIAVMILTICLKSDYQSTITRVEQSNKNHELAILETELGYNTQLLNDVKKISGDLKDNQKNFDKDEMYLLVEEINYSISNIEAEIELRRNK